MVKPIQSEVRVYAEGGGNDCNQLRTDMREAFSKFFENAGLKDRKPRLIPCGSRENAFNDFCMALAQGKNALLLVDSEGPVLSSQTSTINHFEPWAHLKVQDHWIKPSHAHDEDCHLMVQCMESWFFADLEAVSNFYGQGFKANNTLVQPIEKICKDDVFKALNKATKDCKTSAKYGKGPHSFKLLALISPDKVMKASPWAKRFIDEIKKRKSIT